MLSYNKFMRVLLSNDLRPSGSVNRIGGPKVSDLGFFQETVGRNGLLWVFVLLLQIIQVLNCLLFIYDLILYMYFVYKVCLVFTKFNGNCSIMYLLCKIKVVVTFI